MNQLLLTQSQSSIDAWLRQSAPDVEHVGDRSWQLALANGSRVRIAAPVDDPFLLFDAPAPAVSNLDQTPQWLLWNATLAGNAKIALVPRPWHLSLRAETPIDDDGNMPARIAETVRGLHQACQLLAVTLPPSEEAQPARTTPVADDSAHYEASLFALLRETGWPFQERANGAATVELALRGEPSRVLLEENAAGLRAAVEFLRVDSLAANSRLAIATLLLSASGTLRLARSYAVDAEDQFTCGFEVRFAGATTAGELEHALEALAVACWACKDEVNSLLDNSVAETFMAIRNFPPTFEREEF